MASWKRSMMSPQTILTIVILVLMGAFCLLYFPDYKHGLGLIPLFFAFIEPLNIYRLNAKSIDNDSTSTDSKMLEFNPALIVITGPNRKSELQWSWFNRFKEDKDYFQLINTSANGFLLIPKRAFSVEQLADFRKCAEIIKP
jgi:YcxB-like protein